MVRLKVCVPKCCYLGRTYSSTSRFILTSKSYHTYDCRCRLHELRAGGQLVPSHMEALSKLMFTGGEETGPPVALPIQSWVSPSLHRMPKYACQ